MNDELKYNILLVMMVWGIEYLSSHVRIGISTTCAG